MLEKFKKLQISKQELRELNGNELKGIRGGVADECNGWMIVEYEGNTGWATCDGMIWHWQEGLYA